MDLVTYIFKTTPWADILSFFGVLDVDPNQLASVPPGSQCNWISHLARDNMTELHCMKCKVAQNRKERLQLVSYVFGF